MDCCYLWCISFTKLADRGFEMYELKLTYFELLITFVSFFTYVSSTPEFHEKTKCQPPDVEKIQDFIWDVTGVENEGYYFPIGSRTTLNIYNRQFARFGHHSLCHPDDLGKFCLRLQKNETDLTISAYGKRTNASHFKCSRIGGSKWILNCTNNYGFEHHAYVTNGDHKTWLFGSTCWESGESGWVVLSKMATLPVNVEAKILQHAESLGYDPTDVLRVLYDNCST